LPTTPHQLLQQLQKQKTNRMKIKSVSSAVQSAFANLRGLIATFLTMAGVFLGLLSLGVFSATTTLAQAPGSSCAWSAGPVTPSVGVRSVGVYFPANGKFYLMGGRSSDSGGSDFTHPFEYDPTTNTWTTKASTYPDNMVNNMACGVLTDSGTPYIYCVGGSAAGGATATDRVFRYDPVTDTISVVAAPWPGAMGTILPGGFSVYNNNFYILGGFNINIGMVTDIWQFNPSTPAWTHKSAALPTGLGYIPTATIGNLIYTAGGSTWDGVTINDSNFSYVYDPVADTIGTIATIPRATAETRALNFNNQMLVMGGGRDTPNPSNEVDVYDPGSNTWSTSIPAFVTARRNFGTDTDGTSRIWLADGYAPSLPDNSMEILDCGAPTVNLISAASRLTHGHGAGTFDIDMPLTGPSGVEDRRSHSYNAVFNFDAPVTSGQVVVVGGTANVGAITFSGNSMIAQVGGVSAAEVVTLRVQNINGDGQQHGDVPFGFLTGDVNANRTVDRPDLRQIQTDQGQPVTATNFRDDLDLSGRVDIPDAHGVRANAGNSIP
jgi:N-acetylneuraminic acid mutarotase